MLSRDKTIARTLTFALALCVTASFSISRAAAEAQILVDVETGKVLHAENATMPWYPASITKIMTTYATLRAVKEGRITLDKLLVVSPNALAQAPVKMGFPVGTTITVDNALKMLLVKSANDMAVVLAEGVGGSSEKFSDNMNAHAPRLRTTPSPLRNPNRPASRRAGLLCARHGDPGPCRDQRVPGIRLLLASAGHPVWQESAAQLQHADRPLPRRRRHEDRVHLCLRLQSGGDRHARRQAA